MHYTLYINAALNWWFVHINSLYILMHLLRSIYTDLLNPFMNFMAGG